MFCHLGNYLLKLITCVTSQFFLDGLSEKNKGSFLKVAFFVVYGEWRIVEYNIWEEK